MSLNFIKDVFERAIRTFVQAYLGVWMASGAEFDDLISTSSWETGVVAFVLSIAMSFGLKKTGPDKDSPSVI